MRPGSIIQARDANRNNLSIDQVVQVINGPLKGTIGPIRHYDRNYLFLWNKEHVQSNGIFVESCRNVKILGAEFMKGDTGKAIASQNKMVKDPLIGKLVVIIGGVYKGHRGRVCYADDNQATVELSTRCKKIPIEKNLVILLNPEGGDNKQGAKRLDAMREELRAHKRSAPTSKIPPKAKSPLDYLRMAKG